MQRNVWHNLLPEKNCALKLTPKIDLEIVRRSNNKKSFSFGYKKAFAEGSQGNGFKSDRESHNNQNLLGDLLLTLHAMNTRIRCFFGKIKAFLEKIKSRFWLRSKFAKYDWSTPISTAKFHSETQVKEKCSWIARITGWINASK